MSHYYHAVYTEHVKPTRNFLGVVISYLLVFFLLARILEKIMLPAVVGYEMISMVINF